MQAGVVGCHLFSNLRAGTLLFVPIFAAGLVFNFERTCGRLPLANRTLAKAVQTTVTHASQLLRRDLVELTCL